MKCIWGFVLLSILAGCGKQPGPIGPKGDTGVPGQNAPTSSFDIVAIFDPCGDSPGIVDEVLLKLANGQYLVSFSDAANGNNTRFAVLPPGQYVTTDGSNCHFTLTADGEVL